MATKDRVIASFEQSKKLFLEKLADYGTKDIRTLQQVIDRMYEKITRIENISKKGDDPAVVDESLVDTFIDLAGYSIIGKLFVNNEWGDGLPDMDLSDDDNAKINPDFLRDSIQVVREEIAKEFPLARPTKEGDVGFDLYTIEDVVIPAKNEFPVDIRTGVRVKLPKGVWALITNRSSTPRKLGIEIVNGVIDNGYTGELFSCCYNRTGKDITILRGTRLAQFLIFNSNTPTTIEVEELPDTERGETGFGSSGI